ncbi:hypothetical protein N24_1886 [Corynebacterium suranareeae]|uniref:Uncharacterized protein n=1 Tax=Corynebacterium suranareeae TaxID=2506452 RepID=A0A169RYJ6_9CORY|nr:hypothetical protein [Corynebacterium suranareeae]BAU96148.1 hypothetical protein N24_1886 [Corynebacterium suranareeae]
MARAKNKKQRQLQRAHDVVQVENAEAVAVDTVEPITARTGGWPTWVDKVWNLTGSLGGWFAFLVFVIAVWPVAILAAGTVVTIIGTWGVSVLPSLVISSIGASAGVIVSTTDGFLFSWVIPVLFLMIVLALVVMKVLNLIFGALWRFTMTLRQGLYAGREKVSREEAKRARASKKLLKQQAKESQKQRKLDAIYSAEQAEETLAHQEQSESEESDDKNRHDALNDAVVAARSISVRY